MSVTVDSLVEILSLVISAVSVWVNMTSPNLPAAGKEIVVTEHKAITTGGANLVKLLPTTSFLLEALILFVQDLSHTNSSILPNAYHSRTRGTQYCLGVVLLIVSGLLRYLCYRELGRHFTFEVSLLQGHKLVTTGPYSFVRHPGYTATSLFFSGLLCTITASGPGVDYNTTLVAVFWLSGIAISILYLAAVLRTQMDRMKKEDAILKREFGKEWVEWEKRVPWRLVPGLC
ncbi:hypothetical protein D9758_013449 [Tetrapyrgos nigripes]|uniref:Protein-S-isoprenylcysteine O-methyltransferase n=1 Tax=Tetrapyrgos nigripes TaxID=182062 RepID=A0A8H5CRE0_9AGAR|nr:hypothetical protein D9758_013449 [Tetrapyrgos nigripes]